jgi:hypothetical protein
MNSSLECYRLRLVGLLLCLPFIAAGSALAHAEPQKPIRAAASLQVQGTLIGEKPDETAEDISGIACMPATEDGRRCLLINDENQSVQLATLKRDELIADGSDFTLTEDRVPDDVVGNAPAAHSCGRADDFKELDLEAVAFDGSAFVVVGSHGCGRNNNKFRESAFLTFRLTPGPDGGIATVESSFRVGEILKAIPEFASTFTHKLEAEPRGLNIEGAAISGGVLYLGLRAPIKEGSAYVVPVPVASIFDSAASVAPPAKPLAVTLGPSMGIRDLTVLPDKTILVLAGPEVDSTMTDYAIYAWKDVNAPASTLLGTLTDVGDAKAEGLAPLDATDAGQDVIVVFDGPKNGQPKRYRLSAN